MPCPPLPLRRFPHASSIAILALLLGGCAGPAAASDVGKAGNTSAPPASAADIRGQYELADGRLLTITGSGRKMRAQLDGREMTVLVPLGGSVFDAVDGSFRLKFEEHQNGIVIAVELTERPAA